MNAVILAGGRGTRLASRTNGLPKPLALVNGKPLIEYQLELLAQHKAERVVVLCGYGAAEIRDFCGDGSRWNLRLECIDEGRPLGTAGAVLATLDRLPAQFLVLYGDTMVNVDLQRMVSAHAGSGSAATLFLHPNDHPHDSDLVETNAAGQIVAFHPYPHPAKVCLPNQVNAALYVLERNALARFSVAEEPLDFGKTVFPAMLAQGLPLHGYRSPEYIKDAGTPERLDRVASDVVSGRVATSSLDVARPAVLLDRDGTINEEIPFISRPDQLRLLPGAAEAIRRLRGAGYRIAVVTNQPVVARGDCTVEELQQIHNCMETQLSEAGAFVDGIYYCPHHPDRGFEGEVPELKMDCDCRKPKPGLVRQAAEELNLDLSQSWFIGDRTTDLETARVSGMRSILVRTGLGGADGRYPAPPTAVCDDLLAAAIYVVEAGGPHYDKIKG